MTIALTQAIKETDISTPMPLAGHDYAGKRSRSRDMISTPMPLAGHDTNTNTDAQNFEISTPMPLAGHDRYIS